MTVRTIPKPEHGSPEWLAVRWADEHGLRRIPASAAAAIHGEHRYLDPGDLALEMLADNPPSPGGESAAMRRGAFLEPSLLAWAAAELGHDVYAPDRMYVAGRFIATIDGIAGDVAAPTLVVEAKTTRRNWTGTLPRQWYWQGVQQAICTNLDRIIWVILDGNLDLALHEQTVETWEKQHHTEKAEEWLAAIDMGMIPAWVGLNVEQLARLHPQPQVPTVELPAHLHDAVADWQAANARIAADKKIVDECKVRIAKFLADEGAEEATIDGVTVASWAPYDRKGYTVAPSQGRSLKLVKGARR